MRADLIERLRAIVSGPIMEKHRVTIREAADALASQELQAEIARYREALTDIAEGFGPNHMSRYCQRVARAALGGRNDKPASGI